MPKKKTIEDHLANKPEWIKELFENLKEEILKFNMIEEKITHAYIGYKFRVDQKTHRLFIEVHVQNTKINLHLRPADYRNYGTIKITEAPETHKWTLTKLVDVNKESDFDSIMNLIRQSYADVTRFSITV